jgi:hypothetical protein
MKFTPIACLLALAFAADNDITGPGNVVVHGKDNKINGASNTLDGFKNIVKGNFNDIEGDSNEI